MRPTMLPTKPNRHSDSYIMSINSTMEYLPRDNNGKEWREDEMYKEKPGKAKNWADNTTDQNLSSSVIH